MKNIIKSLLVPVMALAVLPLMTSCETDDDSNPTRPKRSCSTRLPMLATFTIWPTARA